MAEHLRAPALSAQVCVAPLVLLFLGPHRCYRHGPHDRPVPHTVPLIVMQGLPHPAHTAEFTTTFSPCILTDALCSQDHFNLCRAEGNLGSPPAPGRGQI